MVEKKTVIDQIEILRSGAVQIRFGLLLLENGKELAHSWHRTSVAPGGDVDEQIETVNGHLAQMGYDPVATSEMVRVKRIVAASK